MGLDLVGGGGSLGTMSGVLEYDPSIGVAEEDCLEWMPEEVLSSNEGLDA